MDVRVYLGTLGRLDRRLETDVDNSTEVIASIVASGVAVNPPLAIRAMLGLRPLRSVSDYVTKLVAI